MAGKKQFPFVQQHDSTDCGPACLSMIAKFHGKTYSLQTLRERSFITRTGVSLLGISDAAETIGMRTIGIKVSFEKLRKEVNLPCIAHWRQNHFIVIYRVDKKFVYVADPASGLIKYTHREFRDGWIETAVQGEKMGICLMVEPTPDFYAHADEKIEKSGFKFLFSYLRPYKKFLTQLLLGMIVGSILQLIFPFLTQAIVDIGISNQNVGFIYLILIAQLMLFFSQTTVEFIRSWILLHISTRINISLISDFLIKLLKLPIRFFDSKNIGDILQRISDHHRIESFLTTSTLTIIFSMVNLLIFGVILAIYSMEIFLIFLIGSIFYLLWVYVFMKKRRELDFKRFSQLSENQSHLIQLINGIQEIKLNGCEKQKRWEWERIQAKLFRVNIKSLSLFQYQQSGSVVINQVKNILITFLAAKSVVDGHMTLGMMLAVQYIIGQLNSPLEQMIGFFHATQDAKISLERLGEVHQKKDEEPDDTPRITRLPSRRDIRVTNLSFHYEGPHSEPVLRNLDVDVPENKITAIVGVSGSGKTTLVKLLLGFYPPTKGDIFVGDNRLSGIHSQVWRQHCGVVMQEGFIFSDTITRNIAPGEEIINKEKLFESVKMANILEFIESLPLGFNTRIGAEGHGLSQGQKQRLLIARAIYKNPDYLFFDEATNALDANNERIIMENLYKFFKGKTVVVVAHRLSTVKNADQIVVLDQGAIVERGSHQELIRKKGSYFELVKNQLELGT